MKEGRLKDSFNHENFIEYDNINNNDNVIIDWKGIQSMRYVGLVGWIEGNDDYETNYLVGNDIYNKCRIINNHDPYFNIDGDLYNIEIVFIADLKAALCSLGFGNGSHILNYFCTLCPCRSFDRGDFSIFACTHCVRLHKYDGYCRHTEELTSDIINEMYNKYNDINCSYSFKQRLIIHPTSV
jgi:hypothetical protein